MIVESNTHRNRTLAGKCVINSSDKLRSLNKSEYTDIVRNVDEKRMDNHTPVPRLVEPMKLSMDVGRIK